MDNIYLNDISFDTFLKYFFSDTYTNDFISDRYSPVFTDCKIKSYCNNYITITNNSTKKTKILKFSTIMSMKSSLIHYLKRMSKYVFQAYNADFDNISNDISYSLTPNEKDISTGTQLYYICPINNELRSAPFNSLTLYQYTVIYNGTYYLNVLRSGNVLYTGYLGDSVTAGEALLTYSFDNNTKLYDNAAAAYYYSITASNAEIGRIYINNLYTKQKIITTVVTSTTDSAANSSTVEYEYTDKYSNKSVYFKAGQEPKTPIERYNTYMRSLRSTSETHLSNTVISYKSDNNIELAPVINGKFNNISDGIVMLGNSANNSSSQGRIYVQTTTATAVPVLSTFSTNSKINIDSDSINNLSLCSITSNGNSWNYEYNGQTKIIAKILHKSSLSSSEVAASTIYTKNSNASFLLIPGNTAVTSTTSNGNTITTCITDNSMLQLSKLITTTTLNMTSATTGTALNSNDSTYYFLTKAEYISNGRYIECTNNSSSALSSDSNINTEFKTSLNALLNNTLKNNSTGLLSTTNFSKYYLIDNYMMAKALLNSTNCVLNYTKTENTGSNYYSYISDSYETGFSPCSLFYITSAQQSIGNSASDANTDITSNTTGISQLHRLHDYAKYTLNVERDFDNSLTTKIYKDKLSNLNAIESSSLPKVHNTEEIATYTPDVDNYSTLICNFVSSLLYAEIPDCTSVSSDLNKSININRIKFYQTNYYEQYLPKSYRYGFNTSDDTNNYTLKYTFNSDASINKALFFDALANKGGD